MMFDLKDTICAISTPPGIGGIHAIRISGVDSWQIARKIFSKGVKCQDDIFFEHMHGVHGFIKDNEQIIDEVILLPYKSPNSYTAEDVVEIFCHGGSYVASIILDLCLKNGARLAKGGDFTFRAFVNGRIDLATVEAINEIIHAENERAVYTASSVLSGSLIDKVNDFREKLFDLVTTLESSIDFPQDVPIFSKKQVLESLEGLNLEIYKLVEASKEGRLIRQGVKVSIVGAPNVGKSSLLNQLLESKRAIITSTPGTTRDTIEEKIFLGSWQIVLVDTAGIRNEKELIEAEKLGIERSKGALRDSDIVLIVFDLTEEKDIEPTEIINLVNGKPNILVGNKIDLVGAKQKSNHFDIAISAKYGTNIDGLKNLIVEKIRSLTQSSPPKAGPPWAEKLKAQDSKCYVNQRQKELLLQGIVHLNSVVDLLKSNSSEDLITGEIKLAISKLDEISGRKVSDDVIRNIFSKFCIGK